MKNAKTAVSAKLKEILSSRIVVNILRAAFFLMLFWGIVNLPHTINKMSAMRLFQQEIDKHSLEPSYIRYADGSPDSEGTVLHLTHYEDQQYVKDILARCKPSFLGKWKKYEATWLAIRIGEYSIGSVGTGSPYYFLPSRAIFSGHEFRLSKEDNEKLWEFLYSIEYSAIRDEEKSVEPNPIIN